MTPALHPASRRGSAILTTVLITVCLSLIVFSVFEYGLFERKMNAHEVLRAQASYAAESLVENACAQAVRQLKANSWVSNDYFNTSTNPTRFTAPPSTAFTNTNIVTSELALKVPNMSDVEIVTIPRQSPDSLGGQAVEIRRLTFYGKATARDSSGREATAYCSETLQIRGQSPATNMAFYNMELELAPGPNMTATGPFFSNKNIYFAVSNDKTLNICGTVTTPQNLLWGRIVEDSLSTWTVSGAAQKGTVKIANKYTAASDPDAEGTYTMQDFYNAGTYYDSVKSSSSSSWTDANWAAKENALFGTNVQTRVDGVTERKLPGIKDLADAHVVIEPAVADTATGYDSNVELQKFANKAAIVIRPPVYAKTTVAKTTTPYTKTTTTTSTKKGVTTTSTSTTAVSGSSSTTSTDTAALTQDASIWVYVPEGSQSGTYTGPYTRENDDGSLSKYYLVDITAKVANFYEEGNSTKILTVTRGNATSGATPGFYDSREATWMTMYNIDVAQLKAAVANTSNTELHTYWNGVVYVESGDDTASTSSTTLADTTSTTTSGSTTTVTTSSVSQTTTVQKEKSGVRLTNGGLGNLPQIPGKSADQDGFTLATNDPLYVQGNFNANGTIDTATPSNNRVADNTTETMACLAADAITVLSNHWTDASSSLDKSNSSKQATQTEVSAVFMTGLVATSAGSSYSGGMHNLPRFLEYWGDNVAFGYRGSLLAFYLSKRGTGKWSNDWYQPPWRIWGWDKRLEKGRKVYGLGRVITFRRIGFSDISAADYGTKTAGL